MLSILFLTFMSSYIATFLIIKYAHLHYPSCADSDLSGPQKFHKEAVPRIGGVSIVFSLITSTLLMKIDGQNASIAIYLLLSAIPVFIIGLLEDLTKKITIKSRLFWTASGALLVIILLQAKITTFDMSYLNVVLLIPFMPLILTIVAITGLVNAYNIIDGFNGLASMVGMLVLISIGYVAYSVSDASIMYFSLSLACAILGFFFWNYPRGHIFLGDGGAYIIGLFVAALSILLTNSHNNVSPWYCLLISAYPVNETLLTIYRRKIHQGKSPGQPDAFHFHTLIYKRVVNRSDRNRKFKNANARTSIYSWYLSALSILPATIFWNSTYILALIYIFYSCIYIWLYWRIVQLKTPKWLHFN